MSSIDAYIGQKGYSIIKNTLPIEEQLKLREELEVKPFVAKSFGCAPSFPIYRESQNKLYIPRFFGIHKFGQPKNIKISEGTNINIEFKGQLRPVQEQAIEAYLKSAKKDGSGLLELFCGSGKTVCALNIISKLNKKTLVIVHKSFLMDQWKERIHQFLPNARVGRIQGEIIDIDDKDIVLGMLQSISMKDYPYSVFQQFGLTILDEVHHIGAEVFSRALFKVVTKYMLGLSATMKRKDGLTKVFKWFLGDIVFTKKREGDEKVLVRGIYYNNTNPEFSETLRNYRGEVAYSSMIKKLCEFNRRSEFILQVLKDTLNEKRDCQVMILAHNKNLLRYLYSGINHQKIGSVGYYIGGMKETDLKLSETKKIIVATYGMAAEGLDIKTLSVLIMATPKTDVEQAVGRILRKKDVDALVIDIVDQHPVFQRQWIKRKRFYKKNKYTIHTTDMDGYKNNKWDHQLKKKSATSYHETPLLTGKCLIMD